MLAQLEEKVGQRQDIVLIALKTDGGGYLGARSYLYQQKATLDKWLIGADDKGILHKTIMGEDGLWDYAIVDPEGRVVDKGECGRYYTIKGKQVFSLSQDDLVEKFGKGKTTTILPVKKKYDPSLDLARTALRCGDLTFAIKRCEKMIKKKVKVGAAKELLQDIMTGLEKVVKTNRTSLGDKDPTNRFYAYMKLRTIMTAAPKHVVGKTAATALKTVRTDKQIKRELGAEKEYWKVITRAAKAKKWVPRATMAKRLGKVATKYPNTLFGKRAAIEAKQR